MQGDRVARIGELIEAIRREVLAELTGESGVAQPESTAAPESASDVRSESGWAGLLALARVVDQVERVGHGLLLRVLGRMGEVRAVPGGVGTWLTAELGYSPGRGRNVASDARRLGSVLEVEGLLSGGELPVGAPRVLARAVYAARGTSVDPAQAVTDTLAALREGGVARAELRVRALEHVVEPGRAETLRARQRVRCFARWGEVGEGMVRLEALLDAGRAEVVRSGMDMLTSGWLRARQYDGVDPLPEDIRSVEQMNAEALVRFAAVFLNATEAQRAKPYIPGVLFIAPSPDPDPASVQDPAARSAVPRPRRDPATGSVPQPVQDPAAASAALQSRRSPAAESVRRSRQDPAAGSVPQSVQDPAVPAPAPALASVPRRPALARVSIPAGCVETARGQWIPAPRRLPESAAVRLTLTPQGLPLAVNGRLLDGNPVARLASADQRVALYWRDRTCTHPGCNRPITWSLHAHHLIPYSLGGRTIVSDLTLLCSEHHVLIHQQADTTA